MITVIGGNGCPGGDLRKVLRIAGEGPAGFGEVFKKEFGHKIGQILQIFIRYF